MSDLLPYVISGIFVLFVWILFIESKIDSLKDEMETMASEISNLQRQGPKRTPEEISDYLDYTLDGPEEVKKFIQGE